MTPLFLDTSFILALEDADDQHHEEARTYWLSFPRKPKPLVTTSYIFDETITLIRKRLDHAHAKEAAQRLRSSPSVNLIHINEDDFEAGWKWFERYPDKGFSFTDCVSFAVMKRLRIKVALTFDRHFAQAGFERKP